MLQMSGVIEHPVSCCPLQWCTVNMAAHAGDLMSVELFFPVIVEA